MDDHVAFVPDPDLEICNYGYGSDQELYVNMEQAWQIYFDKAN
ncbi:MAG: hypothetical protein ACYTF6_11155 [Planctomycetota bacterium]|jgi:hypothetical protein